MPKSAMALRLSAADQEQIIAWLRAPSTAQQVALRCRIVLAAAQGHQDLEVAAQLKINRHTAALWRKRVAAEGIACVWEMRAGRGRKPHYSAEKIQQVVSATLGKAPEGITHWSCREMARAQQISKSTVHHLWQEYNLKPHRQGTFKLSRDPHFLEKLTDVVGLYLNPPDKSLVLCLDEKSQIQALDRTQPGLPLKRGRAGTWTHDYVRNGTTCLFAALEILEGKVVGQCFSRHRHQEFLKFLKQLDGEFPADLALHLVMDNYGTHKHPQVQRWLQHHPRFVVHYIPTSSSWLNQVERWFGELTRKAIRRGAFASVPDLEQAIESFMAHWNRQPKPFVWTATVERIMEKVKRAKTALEKLHPGCTTRKRQKRTQ
jgi:transposase